MSHPEYGQSTLEVPQSLVDDMISHAEASYPDECCGLLAGRSGDNTVELVRSARNINEERARDRYEIDPRDFLELDKELRDTDLDIVGVYHGHPDHPPIASETDLARAWPDYSYIIMSIQSGEFTEARCWRLNDAGDEFEEERLLIKS